MLNRLRQRLSKEDGFTLIELLVVILIIGILAAIAIPAFLSQTSKASDSAAKTQAGTLQTTMEAYASEHNGSFVGATLGELQAIEPTLKDVSTAKAAVSGTPTVDEFTVTSEAVGTKRIYTLKNKKGEIERTCSSAGGGCSAGLTW
jgi:type IV pilus assembly protein PilA